MLAAAALLDHACPGTPPRTPTTTPHLINSADQSPKARIVLERLRNKQAEPLYRLPRDSGELTRGIGRTKQVRFKCDRRKHNLATADWLDPTPLPPPPPPAEVPGAVGRPAQDIVFEPPTHVTRAAKQTTGCSLIRPSDDRSGLPPPKGTCHCVGATGMTHTAMVASKVASREAMRGVKRRPSKADRSIGRFTGMESALLQGPRLVTKALRDTCLATALGQRPNAIVKAKGRDGGKKAKLQHLTKHPSPHNINYGACYKHGIDANGVDVSLLANYSKQFSTEGAQSVRHMPYEFAELGAQLYSILESEDMLSPETLAIGAFTACQVRVYDGDVKAETNLHTDTVVDVDATTGNLKEIDQARCE